MQIIPQQWRNSSSFLSTLGATSQHYPSASANLAMGRGGEWSDSGASSGENSVEGGPIFAVGYPGGYADPMAQGSLADWSLQQHSRISQNVTEQVPVPSSEHVAEIVGRQGQFLHSIIVSPSILAFLIQ